MKPDSLSLIAVVLICALAMILNARLNSQSVQIKELKQNIKDIVTLESQQGATNQKLLELHMQAFREIDSLKAHIKH